MKIDQKTKKEVRRALKERGYKVQFKTVSFADLARDTHETVIVSKDDIKLTGGIVTAKMVSDHAEAYQILEQYGLR